MTKAAAIYLTKLGLARLENAVNRAGNNLSLTGLVDDLIARTNVVPGDKIPANVVTMNSVVYVVDDTGTEQEWTLIYPEEANVTSAKLPVLLPIGVAPLGAHTGKSVKYSTPNSAQHSLRIGRVAFQPEAAG